MHVRARRILSLHARGAHPKRADLLWVSAAGAAGDATAAAGRPLLAPRGRMAAVGSGAGVELVGPQRGISARAV